MGCPKAILHPIKMDNFLYGLMQDTDIWSCSIWYDIVAIRDEMTFADYKEFVPLRIDAEDTYSKHWDYKYRIEFFEEDNGRKLTKGEKQELQKKSDKYLSYHKKLAKQIQIILARNALNMISLTDSR